ncbi:MAG TPA: LTA synthase family protein [Puia sp.]|nr:LTA synthase family protein [Puia sp.]
MPRSRFYRPAAGIFLLLLLHTALRMIFWVYNAYQFTNISTQDAWLIFVRGVQQDLVSIILLNSPVLLLLAAATWLPSVRNTLVRSARWLFVLLNIIGLAINCIDAGYFRFSRHRSNIDLLYVFGDSAGSFGSILSGYWPLLILFIGGIAALVAIGKLLFMTSPGSRVRSSHPAKRVLVQAFIVLLLLLPTGLLTAGRPVIPATPLLSLSPAQLPLAQNSILTFFYSLVRQRRELRPKQYFTGPELDRLVHTRHLLGKEPSPAFTRKNVVICILESFSRCYVMPGDRYKAHTPFFDSLIRKSLFFSRAYANGYMSNQGIVSILGGLPAFLDEPFYYSEYANTPLRSIGNILKEQGYETSFFMGAGKDHFGFGKFTHMAGIDHAYWQNDFSDNTLFDGNWGIFDEPFLQYGAKMLAGQRQPFLSVFFNISSHYPYTIPAVDRSRFADPAMDPQQRSISYVDYAFQRFFGECRKAPWYKNTLFVFSADHWMLPDDKAAFSYVGSAEIPIFIYDPSQETGKVDTTLMSQVDITPTVLDMLHYKGVYTGFGRSMLDTAIAPADRYVLSRFFENYQIIAPGFVLGYNPAEDKSSYLYGYTADSLLRNDLVGKNAYKDVRSRLETLIKANLQAYGQALVKRSLE